MDNGNIKQAIRKGIRNNQGDVVEELSINEYLKRGFRHFLYSFILLIMLTGCDGSPSGTYKSESGLYSIEFENFNKCSWYQDGTFFKGTYKEVNGKYEILMEGQGFYSNTKFVANKRGNDLIITGGTVNGERFIKR